MHAEIAAAVAREHTPGLSVAAAARLEALLGRSPSVLELEVYAALLRGHGVDLGSAWPLRVELGSDAAAVLTVASGCAAGAEAALGLVAAGTQPLVVVLALPGADGAGQGPAERAEVDRLGITASVIAAPAAGAVMGLAVGLAGAAVQARRAPAVGDALIYLGAPTGREGLGGGAGGFCPPPGATAQTQTMAVLRALQLRSGLVLRARLVGKGGLAQAAAGLLVGSQILLDAVPRHPVVLHPKELLLAETSSRALIVVPAERVDEVLTAAAAQGVAAAAIGVITAEDRLSVLMKPRGAPVARPICELPLRALQRELAPALPSDAQDHELAARPGGEPESANPLLLHLRAQASPRSGSTTLLHAGPPTLMLVVHSLAPTAEPTTAGAARRALSAATSAVRETGATPVGAAWLLGAAAGSAEAALDPVELRATAAQLGMTLVAARSEAVPPDGLMVAVGQNSAAGSAVATSFPGSGFLVAVLGFDGGDAAQEHAAGELCSELIHGGLCVTAQSIGPGGLLLALARACSLNGVGCTAVLPVPAAAPSPPATGLEALLREEPGRYLLAIPAHRQADARLLASDRGVPLWPLGRTAGTELLIRRSDGPAPTPFIEVLRLPVATLAAVLRPD